MLADTVECPSCTTKGEKFYCFEIPGHASLLRCQNCDSLWVEQAPGKLVALAPVLEKMRLGDDLLQAVSSDTVAGESILDAMEKFSASTKVLWFSYAGKVRQLMQQLEGRAHAVHGELARRAIADASLADLLATAKQIVDLVSAKPDGVKKADPA